MKFTLSWLRDHLDTDSSVETLADTLSSIGLEVEGIENPAAKLSAFTIARVVEAKQHPNADKLRVCQVDTGKAIVEVVCGAPNARTGLVGVFAPMGTYIPGTGLTLEAKPVRGVVSNGMLCSERELELSNEHDGIIELDPKFSDQLGQRFVDVMGLDDPVIEIKVTPNRPDALGVRGIARDLAAAGHGKLKPEKRGWTGEGKFDCPVPIELRFPKGDEGACPVFGGLYIKGVKNGPSPAWLQQRLKAIGLRPISTLVDITNYITYDRARPLHVYDADKLKGTIHARFGKMGESFLALDGKTYQADETTTVIADDSGVLGFGGIIGGESTGCSETTTNVLIESAYFDPVRTATTGRRNVINSDARYRFERGIDPSSVPVGIALAAEMILDLCGGMPSRPLTAGKVPERKLILEFDPVRVRKLAGLDTPNVEVERVLTALGFKSKPKGDRLEVSVPSWRPDVHGPADLVEEVVRIVGIDKVPFSALPRERGVARAVLTETQKRVRRARRVLAGRGLVEAITWSFITRDQAQSFGGGTEALELANPISSEMTSMRPSLLPGLLSALQRNLDRSQSDFGLFEVGQAYRGIKPEDQYFAAAGVRSGRSHIAGSGRHWSGAKDDADLFDAKSDAAALIAALGLDAHRLMVTRDAPAWFHPGRSGTIRLGPKVALAHFGELHPAALRRFNIDAPAVAFEVFLDALPQPKKKPTKARPAFVAGDLQPVRRDFAFVVSSDVAAADVVKAAESVDKKLISQVSVFDLFEGPSLGEGKTSIAIEVTLQPKERTLTDPEIEQVAQRIVGEVKRQTGGEIRG
ncbi:MAG: phenylalanine--tRNA ligase subunit beta [Hyphomicrobiaceae bacterium]